MVAEFEQPAGTNAVVGRAADHAVGRADHARDCAAAVAEVGNRAGIDRSAVVPIRFNGNDGLAIEEKVDGIADGVACGTANETVRCAHGARNAAGSAAPGDGTQITVPPLTQHQVIPARCGGDAVVADAIVHRGTDEAVGRIHDGARGRTWSPGSIKSVTEGGRSAQSVPLRAVDHEVAVAEFLVIHASRCVAADKIAGIDSAHQTVGIAHHAGRAIDAIAPGDCASLNSPLRAEHQIVAAGEEFRHKRGVKHRIRPDTVITAAADQAVGGVDQSAGDRRRPESPRGATPEGDRTGILGTGIRVIPVGTQNEEVSIREREYAVRSDMVAADSRHDIRRIADQAVCRADGADRGAGARHPGRRAATDIPAGVDNHEVAVKQVLRIKIDSTHAVIGEAADQTVGQAHRAGNSGDRAAQRERTGVGRTGTGIVPERAAHQVIGRKDFDAIAANLIARLGANQAVGGSDRAGRERSRGAESDRATREVPVGRDQQIVATGEWIQLPIALSDPIVDTAPDQTVGGANHSGRDASRAGAEEGDRPGIGADAVVPLGAADQQIAVCEPVDGETAAAAGYAEADLVARSRADQAVGRRNRSRDTRRHQCYRAAPAVPLR